MSAKRKVAWEDETPEDRARSVRRGYRDALSPSVAAQKRFPLANYPCSRCEAGEVPRLSDHGGTEFSWEHGPDGGRSGCTRFGDSTHCGNRPRAGSARSLWLKPSTGRMHYDMEGAKCTTRPRTPEQYEHACKFVVGETWRDIMESVRSGCEECRPETLASILGYTVEEIRTIVKVEGAAYDHYNHPNWDDDKAMKALIKGERYDPSDGWEPVQHADTSEKPTS